MHVDLTEQQQLQALSTAELLRHVVEEARLLTKAEVLHAKHELKDEVQRVKRAAILFGVAMGLGLSGLSVLFVALALALPWPPPVSALVVGSVLVLIAGGAAAIAYGRLPKRPMEQTQARIRNDVRLTREQIA
jgi:hypothetical protein